MTENNKEKVYTPIEIANISLSVLAEELHREHRIQEIGKAQGTREERLSGIDRHIAFLEGMAVGIKLQSDGLVPSGDLTAGGPFAFCVVDTIYSKMEELLGKQIRPRKKKD